jgi:hypothetical protein
MNFTSIFFCPNNRTWQYGSTIICVYIHIYILNCLVFYTNGCMILMWIYIHMQWLFVTIQCNIDHNRKEKKKCEERKLHNVRKIFYYKEARTPHWQKRLDHTIDLSCLTVNRIVLSTWINNDDIIKIINMCKKKPMIHHDSCVFFFDIYMNEISQVIKLKTIYSSLSYIFFLFFFFLNVCLLITQK